MEIMLTLNIMSTNMRSNKVNITCGFLLLLIAVTVLAGPGTALAALTAAAVHELGHMAALRCFGARIDGFRLGASGAEIVYTKGLSYRGEIVAALSGPLAGALLAGAAVWAGRRWNMERLYPLAAVSALYTAINLVPAGPTDGGRALNAWLSLALGPDRAYYIGLAVDCVVITAALAAGVWVLLRTKGNCSLLVYGVFLLNGCCKCRGFGVKSKLA